MECQSSTFEDSTLLSLNSISYGLQFSNMNTPTNNTDMGSSKENLEVSTTHDENVMWTEVDEKRIRRRLDLKMLPFIFCLYLLCFIDRFASLPPLNIGRYLIRCARSNIGNAKIQGMEVDLKLVGYQFNWTLTIFFISYAMIEVPSNIALKILGGRLYIPLLVTSFGIISMSTAFVHNWGGLMACRFMLGVAEGGMMPGVAFYLSTFYRRHELAFRVGIFISGAAIAGAFGGLLAAGLSPIPEWGAESSRISNWRNIFFFEGLVSILFGLAAMYFLPAAPNKCTFLSASDQYIALERIQRENREQLVEKVQLHHVYRAVFNINTVICGIGLGLVNCSVQSIALFTPTILRALGWTALKTQLYSVPPFVLGGLWAILNCWLSDIYKVRGVFAAGNSIIAVSGFIVLATAKTATARYVALFFACAGSFPSGPAYITWVMNNASGPTIRAVSVACVTMCGQVGAVIATWAYLPTDAPNYRIGHSINLGAQILSIMVSLGGVCYVLWENKARDNGKRDHRLEGLSPEDEQQLGYRHPEIRYTT